MNGIIITANAPSRQPNHQSQCGCLTKPPACQSPDYFLSKVSRFTRPPPTQRTHRHNFQHKQHDAQSHSRKKSLKKRGPSRPGKNSSPPPRNPLQQYYPEQQAAPQIIQDPMPGVALGSLPMHTLSPPKNPSIYVADDATTMRGSYQQGPPLSSRVYASSEPATPYKPRINFVTSSTMSRPGPITIQVQEPMSERVIVSRRQSLQTGKIYESLKNLNQLKEEYMESSSQSEQNGYASAKPPQYDSLFFSKSQQLKDSLFANPNNASMDSQKLLSTRSAAQSGRMKRDREGYLLSSNILKGKAKKVEQAQRSHHLTNITDIEEICSQNDSESNQEIKESIVLSRLNNGRSQDRFFKNSLAMGKMTSANSTHTMPTTMVGSVFTRKDTLEEKRGLRGTAL